MKVDDYDLGDIMAIRIEYADEYLCSKKNKLIKKLRIQTANDCSKALWDNFIGERKRGTEERVLSPVKSLG